MLRTGMSWWMVLLALSGCLGGGCRTTERTMICLSRIKSPVIITTPAVNGPFAEKDLLALGINPVTRQPLPAAAAATNHAAASAPAHTVRYDSLEDLRAKDTVVMVCLSGGGARAARMAAHTLAALEEKYNAMYPLETGSHSLAGRIDAWSTSSGGSVYASFVALHSQRGLRTNTFAALAGGGNVHSATQYLGDMAAFYYLWPLNLGYAPMMQLVTDWDTLDLFAHSLALLQEERFPLVPFTRNWTLGDLPERPRFYFNATCRDTSRPFIFTQSVVHRDLSGDPLARLAPDPLFRWIENVSPAAAPREPFLHASTLEDLGSPPNRFPLAYAAMASAAFPGVFDPLPLRCYHDPTNSPPWWRRKQVSIVDGGLYDNSGVATALELFDFLRSTGESRPKKLILLAVDADNDRQSYAGAETPSAVPWQFGLPVRGATTMVSTLKKLYNRQQDLVTAATHRHIRDLADQHLIEFFPVRLKDARGTVAGDFGSDGALEQNLAHVDIFGLVKNIPTDFVVTAREDRQLQFVVHKLLADAPAGQPSLAERFARAVREAP